MPAIRLRVGFLAALLGLCLATATADADCALGPVNDLQAMQTLLDGWAATTSLPPFDKQRWDLSIDRGSTRLTLPFATGTLTLAWELDERCSPTAITIEASADYAGTRPDIAAVEQLAQAIRMGAMVEHREPHVFSATGWRFFVRGVGIVLVGLVLGLGWGWHASGLRLRDMPVLALARLRRMRRITVLRLLGLAAIVALLPYQSPPPTQPFASDCLAANSVVLIGILPLITFLWLAISGYFGYGSPRRTDWPGLCVFLLALGIREGYARHAIEEIEIHFFHGALGIFPNRHSVIYPLLQMFLQPLAGDPYLFIMHVNGVLGALAALPLYLFVRQRTNSRTTATVVAMLFAVHPIIVQMSPTDGQYPLVLFSWFSGLALLTSDTVGSKQLFGGATLLGIAATCRAEGSLYLVASLLLIDVHALLAAARRHVGASVLSSSVVLGLVAVHMYYCFAVHVPQGEHLPNIGSFTLADVVRAGLLSYDYNDRIVVALVAMGALVGLADKRLRIGLGAALGTLVVVWPVSMTTTGGFTILHRLVPVCALQVIAAGVGVAWVTRVLASAMRQHWAAITPALALVLYLFATHRHEIHNPNAVTDEFWMLRNHLAPGGRVKKDCTLLSFGRTMDTDIHDFAQVLPGITSTHCEQEDCVRVVSADGCFYYLRSLNCYFAEVRTPAECLEHGRTPAGDIDACIDPRCAQLERVLELSPVEERTVDLYSVFHGLPDRPQWPRSVDIGLYRVIGVKR